jgi:membrane protein required for colicin V production
MAAVSFHYVDLLVIAVILISAGFAIFRGFVAETLSIVAWAIAAFASLYFGPDAAPLFAGMMSPVFARIAAYVFVFLAVVIPLSFASARFSDSVKKSAIGPLDRSLGGVFGVVRGLIVLGMCYLLLCLIQPPSRQPMWLTHSWTYPLVQDTSDVLLSLVPTRDSRIFDNGSARREERSISAQKSAEPVVEPRPKPMPNRYAKRPQKTYGAKERRALDRLIQATDGTEKKP